MTWTCLHSAVQSSDVSVMIQSLLHASAGSVFENNKILNVFLKGPRIWKIGQYFTFFVMRIPCFRGKHLGNHWTCEVFGYKFYFHSGLIHAKINVTHSAKLTSNIVDIFLVISFAPNLRQTKIHQPNVPNSEWLGAKHFLAKFCGGRTWKNQLWGKRNCQFVAAI